MLQPKRVKYRKSHKGNRRGNAHAGYAVTFGDFGLQALAAAWLTDRQIEAARRAITTGIRWAASPSVSMAQQPIRASSSTSGKTTDVRVQQRSDRQIRCSK